MIGAILPVSQMPFAFIACKGKNFTFMLKGKAVPLQAQQVDRGVALSFHDLSARRGYVVSITPQPVYPQ
jgi:hypothetical protein